MNQRVIKIGTRKSELALYQANLVADLLNARGIATEIIEISSFGDENLTQPIYKLGTSGVFTKSIDIALLNDKVDIAVHSLKDVPTDLPQGIVNMAVIERSHVSDVVKLNHAINADHNQTVATGSIRRKAQWLAKYPNHTIVPLRGNVNTRLQKLANNDWTGAIFAKAGLDRINLLGDNYADLDWMIPAPAQGAIVVACRAGDPDYKKLREILNHELTEINTTIEREFMNAVEAGCSFPLGAIATRQDDHIEFKALVISPDGKRKAELNAKIELDEAEGYGKKAGLAFAKQHQSFINQIKSSI